MAPACVPIPVSENHYNRPRLPGPVVEKAKQLKEEKEFASLGEAIRHMCQEGGFDV